MSELTPEATGMKTVEELLALAAAHHRHLCPRQVLGVRMGLWAGEWLALPVPQTAKRLLTIVETDGCFADGVAVATNCWLGRRTMRLEDYGKVAATFIDTQTERAVRLAPHPESRHRAAAYAPDARNRWQAMLFGYQRMPVEELLILQPVMLHTPVAKLVSRAGRRVNCSRCGEEILNEREVLLDEQIFCQSCAGPSYYQVLASVDGI